MIMAWKSVYDPRDTGYYFIVMALEQKSGRQFRFTLFRTRFFFHFSRHISHCVQLFNLNFINAMILHLSALLNFLLPARRIGDRAVQPALARADTRVE